MSLHLNTKKVKTALIEHVLDNFKPENYDVESTDANKNLFDQINYMRINGESLYQVALRYVEGGSVLVYYYDQRKFLKTIMEQTDAEANRFSDAMVWQTYTHACARTIANLYTQYAEAN